MFRVCLFAILMACLPAGGGADAHAATPAEAIDPARAYLELIQRSGGGWSAILDTRTTALGIILLETTGENMDGAKSALAGQEAGSTSELIWQALGTRDAARASQLEGIQQPDGSWENNLELTSWAVWALSLSGRPNAAGAAYLSNQRNLDGSWGAPVGARPDTTGLVLQALSSNDATIPAASAIRFLQDTKETGEGWGTPLDTALALLGLFESDLPEIEGASNLVALQRADGSWKDWREPDDAYVTALSLIALQEILPGHASVNRGVQWLKARRQGAAWYLTNTSVRDTAAVLEALESIGDATSPVYAGGIDALEAMTGAGLQDTALPVPLLFRSGRSVAGRMNAIADLARPGGGFGADIHSGASVDDTRAALDAHIAAASGSARIDDAVAWLVGNQLSNGGWGAESAGDALSNASPEIFLTAQNLRTLSAAPRGTGRLSAMTKGGAFLLARQNLDGSFGSGEDAAVNTAAAALALMDLSRAGAVSNAQGSIDQAIVWLTGAQTVVLTTPTPTPTATSTPVETPLPTLTPAPGDLVPDNAIGSLDLFAFATVWETAAAPGLAQQADLDNSGQVDSGDVLEFFALWHTAFPVQAGLAPGGSNQSMRSAISPIGSWNGRVFDTALALEAIGEYVGPPAGEYVEFTLSGHVYLADGTTPAAEAAVQLSVLEGELRGGAAILLEIADGEGFYTFGNLAATPETVLFVLPVFPFGTGQEVSVSTITPGSTVTVDFVTGG